MHACIYLIMHACAHMYVCMFACMFALYVFMHIYTQCIYMLMPKQKCVHLLMYSYWQACKCVCTYECVEISLIELHACMHEFIHMHTYTHTNRHYPYTNVLEKLLDVRSGTPPRFPYWPCTHVVAAPVGAWFLCSIRC